MTKLPTSSVSTVRFCRSRQGAGRRVKHYRTLAMLVSQPTSNSRGHQYFIIQACVLDHVVVRCVCGTRDGVHVCNVIPVHAVTFRVTSPVKTLVTISFAFTWTSSTVADESIYSSVKPMAVARKR